MSVDEGTQGPVSWHLRQIADELDRRGQGDLAEGLDMVRAEVARVTVRLRRQGELGLASRLADRQDERDQ